MMESRRRFLGILGGLSALPALAACTPQAEKLAIGFQRNGILFIARLRGELDKRLQARIDVTPQWVEFPSGPPLIEAMSAGAVDFGAVGDTPVIYAQAAGLSLKLVAGKVYEGGIANSFLTGPQSGIRSAADLKGRRIGYTRGSSAEVTALVALEDAGLTANDVERVFLAPGDGVSALERGSIDALFTWDPFFSIAEKRFGAREVRFDRAGLLATMLYIARTKLVEQQAPLLFAFLDELEGEADWANANQPEARKLLATASRMPDADIAAMLARTGANPFGLEPPSERLVKNQQRVADTLLKGGSIQQPVDVRQIVWHGWKPAQP